MTPMIPSLCLVMVTFFQTIDNFMGFGEFFCVLKEDSSYLRALVSISLLSESLGVRSLVEVLPRLQYFLLQLKSVNMALLEVPREDP